MCVFLCFYITKSKGPAQSPLLWIRLGEKWAVPWAAELINTHLIWCQKWENLSWHTTYNSSFRYYYTDNIPREQCTPISISITLVNCRSQTKESPQLKEYIASLIYSSLRRKGLCFEHWIEFIAITSKHLSISCIGASLSIYFIGRSQLKGNACLFWLTTDNYYYNSIVNLC